MRKYSIAFRLIVQSAAIAVLASCSSASSVHQTVENKYPIVVQPQQHVVKIPTTSNALTPAQKRRLSRLSHVHSAYGESAITIASPEGEDTRMKVSQIAAELNSHGVGMDQIQTGSYAPSYDDFMTSAGNSTGLDDVSLMDVSPIYVSFVKNAATADNCDDQWDTNPLVDSYQNKQSKGFGCATQNNLAAMLEDPSDIVAPVPMGKASAENRGRVLDLYLKGEATTTPPLSVSETRQE